MGRVARGAVIVTKSATAFDQDAKKRAAALKACGFVKDGMIVGLGTGSTVQHALDEIGRLVGAGLTIKGIPTSNRTEAEARRLGIPLTTLDAYPRVDLTIDGADELDPELNLVKGGGGALVREKVIASSSRMVIIIADDSKFVTRLGTTFPIPVEVLPFARAYVQRGLEALGARVALRAKDGKAYVTDNGCWILDARFPGVPNPAKMETEITLLSGVLDCGIFTGLADLAFVGTTDGVRRIQARR